MTDGLYDGYLKNKNVTPVIPDAELREDIDKLIMEQIIPSKINPNFVALVAQKIKTLDCDAVLLGCTELPEVYNDINLGKPVIDTTRLLGKIALNFSLGLLPELDQTKYSVKMF